MSPGHSAPMFGGGQSPLPGCSNSSPDTVTTILWCQFVSEFALVFISASLSCLKWVSFRPMIQPGKSVVHFLRGGGSRE